MLDLELLHFWMTQSVVDFGGRAEITTLFQTTIVQIAFEYDFLMHAMLSLAACHLSHTRPQKSSMYRYASDRHAAIGLSLSQPHILNLDETNCHACFAFSTITFAHAWASQDRTKPSTLFFTPSQADEEADTLQIKWVKLHRGTHSILGSVSPTLRNGPLKPLFTPWGRVDPNRPNLLQDEDKKWIDDLSEAWSSSMMSEAQKAVMPAALDTIRRVFSMLTYCEEVDKTSCIMSWFSRVSDEFLEMLENKVPEALLLVAYLSVALKRIGYLRQWWLDGMAENLLGTILNELGEGWERWTSWPIEQVFTRKGIQDYRGNIVGP
ncbi:uncharacterized protein BP5553_00789 [Venustampulla echinocandica]|uniref:C6 transcription factor n=1 Tax=Venustampulla echinocandica TaxID=2656787 RepID=A0A370TZ69_9HELO|nr:uncharacterized protein BP5553_00789 [Venustampulla echinocandica]RDL40810.1 hypothetical protein BP5553_00789 [Venustampulla echinocandica]